MISRVHAVNERAIRADAAYVFYWMTSFRRTRSNFALERAVWHARELQKPLVVLEALVCDYPWASDRLHRFVVDGMRDNAAAFGGTSVTYLPYVEPAPRAGRGLVAALANDAAVVVTDDFPAFFIPKIIAAASTQMSVRLEAVDSNGILPIRSFGRDAPTAYVFRRYLQRTLREHLRLWPAALDYATLAGPTAIDRTILERWPMATAEDLQAPDRLIASLPIDHRVPPVPTRGGPVEARLALARFVSGPLARYGNDHSQAERPGTSRLSPYLHFGHIATHEIFEDVMSAERWTSRKLSPDARGAREGWWGVSPGAEAFLDQLITWRELGFNMCAARPGDYAAFNALPQWALKTLAKHARDKRPVLYTIDELMEARTHDPVWNAAQRQLIREGWMHNYLRMLWGKKILEWSPTPEVALDAMVAIMNRLAIDGRDPNSYSGYLWTLGRYDRPWGPERPIFGTVRYMSSENTARKMRMKPGRGLMAQDSLI